ncbi:hypothetical protein CRG98_027989, partial [Punica granatum]
MARVLITGSSLRLLRPPPRRSRGEEKQQLRLRRLLPTTPLPQLIGLRFEFIETEISTTKTQREKERPLALLRLRAAAIASSQLQLQLLPLSSRSFLAPLSLSSRRTLGLRRSFALSVSATLTANSTPARSGVYTVGDFMTRKEEMHVVKPTTSVDD